jgi:hypothetical protein
LGTDDVNARNNLGAEFEDLRSEESEVQIIEEPRNTNVQFFQTTSFNNQNDEGRFNNLRAQPQKSVINFAMFIATSQKLDYTGTAYVESHVNILQILNWDSIQLNNFLKRMSSGECIENGELFTWERAFDSMIFFVAKVYPGKVRMLHAYKLEMRNLWLRLSRQLEWSGFLKLEQELRATCMERFNTIWCQASDPAWSTTILQFLHSHPKHQRTVYLDRVEKFGDPDASVKRRYKHLMEEREDRGGWKREEGMKREETNRKRKADEGDPGQSCYNYNDNLACHHSCTRIHACMGCGKTSCRFVSCNTNPKQLKVREHQRVKRNGGM